ncbi:MAG: transposase [Deltaproteobacteria bacterium]|jgi:hypothetical protein|nr:transposase [Deltaproteobacteria bacterium]
MARPIDPNAQHRIKPHVTKGYTYASTQPPYVDPLTGKRKYRHVHWGTVDGDMKFIPGARFFMASPEERSRLIFPESWDLTEAAKAAGPEQPGRPIHDADCLNRMYGDIWLLEQVASRTGLRQDLEKVFHGDAEIVDGVLTLAMFSYLTQFAFGRAARWQRIAKTPSPGELTPSAVTRLTRSITEQHRRNLLRLRAAGLGGHGLCAAESTSSSAYGDGIAGLHWGKSQEDPMLEQTTEVVVYTLSGHMPVHYRTFPGNRPDSSSLDAILKDLELADFKDVVLITDRGYETLGNLDKLIMSGQPSVMSAKTSQKEVARAIGRLGEFDSRPKGMTLDRDAELFYGQYDIEYEAESRRGTVKAATMLKLNLYLDPVRRSRELAEIEMAIETQRESLEGLIKTKSAIDEATIKGDYRYFKVVRDPATKVIQSFGLKDGNVAKDHTLSGFIAILTNGLDLDAMAVLDIYRLRDEQEKYFQQMKDLTVSDRQLNWSDEGETGRLFILFVSLILGSYVSNVWKSTKMHDSFSSSPEMVDEMRAIRCIERTNGDKAITPFTGAQLDICDAFGFEVPDGCAPAYAARQKSRPGRGRPARRNDGRNF